MGSQRHVPATRSLLPNMQEKETSRIKVISVTCYILSPADGIVKNLVQLLTERYCVSTLYKRRKLCFLAPSINRQIWKIQATALNSGYNNTNISLISHVALPILHSITRQKMLSAQTIPTTYPDVASAEKML